MFPFTLFLFSPVIEPQIAMINTIALDKQILRGTRDLHTYGPILLHFERKR